MKDTFGLKDISKIITKYSKWDYRLKSIVYDLCYVEKDPKEAIPQRS